MTCDKNVKTHKMINKICAQIGLLEINVFVFKLFVNTIDFLEQANGRLIMIVIEMMTNSFICLFNLRRNNDGVLHELRSKIIEMTQEIQGNEEIQR